LRAKIQLVDWFLAGFISRIRADKPGTTQELARLTKEETTIHDELENILAERAELLKTNPLLGDKKCQ
jgi:hypothetical protein